MPRSLARKCDGHENFRNFAYLEDYPWYISPHLWTSLAADSGSSVAIVAGDNGVLALTTGATNNNEAASYSTNKLWTIAANKTIWMECSIQYSEAATSAANVAVGFASAFGANLLVDDGAGPAANFSGCLIYKVDGGTVWKVVSSIGTSQLINTSTTTAGGAAFQKLGVEIVPVTSTVAEVSFFVNDVPLYDAAITSRNQAIKHQLTYTSAAAMNVGSYVKDGSGTGEVLNVDWLAWSKTR
jgi:hypothetical protein